jgi:anti-sigma factor RsiW
VDCQLIQRDLIGYHLGTVSDGEREAVETHLVGCASCLRTYMALKAHGDRAAHGDEGPSEAARVKLRAAVEARFRPTAARRVGRWLKRPVPLYQGLTVAVVLALAAALAPPLARALQHPSAAQDSQRVDSARPAAESLTIY